MKKKQSKAESAEQAAPSKNSLTVWRFRYTEAQKESPNRITPGMNAYHPRNRHGKMIEPHTEHP